MTEWEIGEDAPPQTGHSLLVTAYRVLHGRPGGG
jgi:hypothetical protein